MGEKPLEKIVLLLAPALWNPIRPEAQVFGDFRRHSGFGLTAHQASHLSKRRTRTANGRALGWRDARGEGGAERGL